MSAALKLASAIVRAEMENRADLDPLSRETKDAAAEFLAHLLVAKHKFRMRGADMEKIDERARAIWVGIVGVDGTQETKLQAVDDLVLFVADAEGVCLA